MPFQSEKQRRYMHANLPDIANRWEKDYAGGGFIPSHQAGIYGLEDGGRTGFQYGSPHEEAAASYAGTHAGENAARDHGGNTAGDHHPHGGIASTYSAPEKTTTTTGGDGPDPHGGDWEEGWLNEDLKKVNEIINDPNANRRDKEQALVWKDQFNKQIAASEKDRGKSSLASNIIKGIVTLGTAGAGAGLFGKDAMKVAELYSNYKKAKQFKTAWDTGKFKEFNLSNIKNKLISSDQKIINALPEGHPERIQKEGFKETVDVPDREGVTDDRDRATTSIKIEDIETVNDANAEKARLLRKYQEMEWAAYLAKLEQQEMEAKKQAWLRQLRQTYMSAQGGRVPAGYNTGGLSNLFRLKNR